MDERKWGNEGKGKWRQWDRESVEVLRRKGGRVSAKLSTEFYFSRYREFT